MAEPFQIQYDINQFYGHGNDIRPVLVQEVDSINMSIINILRTQIGTRVRNRKFGSNILSIIFEQDVSEDNAYSLLDDIARAIERWEKRVDFLINESTVLVNRLLRRYEVQLVYRIVRSNRVQEFRVAIPVDQ